MNRTFEFRYANELAGAFVLLISLALLGTFYVASRAQGWLEPKLELQVLLPARSGAFGLQEGAEVRVVGVLAGRVGRIDPVSARDLESRLIVAGRFGRFVRADSVAIVRRKFEVTGDAFVDITLGDPTLPAMTNGSTIALAKDEELIGAARAMLSDMRKQLLPMLEEVSGIISNVNGITASLRNGDGALGRSIVDTNLAANVDGTIADLRRTSATLPALAQHVQATVDEAQGVAVSTREVAARLPALVAQTQMLMTNLTALAADLSGQMGNVHAVLRSTDATLHETERLVRGIQQVWLWRDHVPPETGGALLAWPPPATATATAAGGAP